MSDPVLISDNVVTKSGLVLTGEDFNWTEVDTINGNSFLNTSNATLIIKSIGYSNPITLHCAPPEPVIPVPDFEVLPIPEIVVEIPASNAGFQAVILKVPVGYSISGVPKLITWTHEGDAPAEGKVQIATIKQV